MRLHTDMQMPHGRGLLLIKNPGAGDGYIRPPGRRKPAITAVLLPIHCGETMVANGNEGAANCFCNFNDANPVINVA